MLAPGRLVDRQRHDHLFEIAGDPVLGIRFPATDLPQSVLAAGVVQLLEPVEAVPAVAHNLKAGETLPSCFASSRTPSLVLMIFCSVVIVPPWRLSN
jgi:hypothetical protein